MSLLHSCHASRAAPDSPRHLTAERSTSLDNIDFLHLAMYGEDLVLGD